MYKSSGARSRLLRVASTIGVVAALTLSACGSDPAANRVDDEGGTTPEALTQEEWDDVVAKAKEEGQVTVFSSSGNTVEYFEKFEELYPEIDVTVEAQPTSDLVGSLDQQLEVANPAADVAFHSQSGWFTEKADAGLLAPLQYSPDITEGYEGIDELTRYYGPVIKLPWVLAYNTNNEPAATVDELLDMAEGKNVALLSATTAPATAHQWMTWDESTPDLLERVADLDPQVEVSSVTMAQSLAAGALDYVFPLPPGSIVPLRDEGAPVEQVVLEDATAIQYGVGILPAAQHPNAAQVFANWVMSQEGQEHLVQRFAPAAVVSGTGDSLAWDELSTFETSGRTQDEVDGWIEDEWSSVEP